MQAAEAGGETLQTSVPSCVAMPKAENVILPKSAGFQLNPKSVVSHPSAGGCQNSLKPVGGSQTLALATAAMVSVEPEAPQGPSVPSVQPCHLLTFSPIKIPVLASPFPGKVAPADTNKQLFIFTLQRREASERERCCR